MDELDNLPAFIECIRQQSYPRIKLFICVNQPDSWWGRADKLQACHNNIASLHYLEDIHGIALTVIDRCSEGKGWTAKRSGVGWARKVLMDAIADIANANDVLISLDADTTFERDYFKTVVEGVTANPQASAIAVPYYHRLTGDEEKDRAILRYEIYMRHYAINLWRIGSPYAFTAVGSAIALSMKAYRAINGITPHKSGEDFYFLQKLRKYGPVLTWIPQKVYPAARYSDRVGFGTGPAMIKGRTGNWDSYPIYPYAYFDEVRQTYDLFPALFAHDAITPFDGFLKERFGEDSIWKPLRDNSKTQKQFVRACHHKIDAFRVLQFLKWRSSVDEAANEESLFHCFETHYTEVFRSLSFSVSGFLLSTAPVKHLDELRNLLCNIESEYQKKYKLTDPF